MFIDLRKIYHFTHLPHAADAPLPKGAGIYYECTSCKRIISSVPFVAAKCECGNLAGKAGHVAIHDVAKVAVLSGHLR